MHKFWCKGEETIIIDDDFSAYNNGSSLSFNSNWVNYKIQTR